MYKGAEIMDETIINDEQENVQETIPESDDTDFLENDSIIRKKEGRADDSATMQTALCMIIAVGLILLNVFRPDTAEDIFLRLKEISEVADVIPNPIDIIARYLENI